MEYRLTATVSVLGRRVALIWCEAIGVFMLAYGSHQMKVLFYYGRTSPLRPASVGSRDVGLLRGGDCRRFAVYF
jgi:hypothetical protein